METPLNELIAEMQQHAKTCETVAQDKTQEALTGDAKDKEKNEQEARMWAIKAQVWREAEAVVCRFV